MLQLYHLVFVCIPSFAIAQGGIYAVNLTSFTVEIPLGSGNFTTEDLTISPDTSLAIDESSVKYYLYTTTENGTEINRDNVISANIDVTKDTIFVIHGWVDSYQADSSQTVKDAYLESRDVNVILVDWEPISNRLYVNARYAVQGVGEIVAEFIQYMTVNVDLDLNKTALVGHSLGAHICGAAGNALSGIVNRIVGLDPAGPLFLLTSSSDKLESGDAQFVEVIHTCAGLAGYPLALGDSDYWPNGGGCTQPGCDALELAACSHARSYIYYGESLVSGGFLANKCSNYVTYSLGFCSTSDEALMGEDVEDRSTGNFYLNTNGVEPYAQG